MFLNLDADFTASTTSIANPPLCMTVSSDINVGVGAQGSFFSLFDKSVGKSLFDKTFPLFQGSAFPLALRGTRVVFLLLKQFSSKLETEAEVILTPFIKLISSAHFLAPLGLSLRRCPPHVMRSYCPHQGHVPPRDYRSSRRSMNRNRNCLRLRFLSRMRNSRSVWREVAPYHGLSPHNPECLRALVTAVFFLARMLDSS